MRTWSHRSRRTVQIDSSSPKIDEDRDGHGVTLKFNHFYGYPAALIARWLGCSRRTAKRYKAGRAVPRPALRLFTLHAERRVLPEGWIYNEKTQELVTPNGEAYPLKTLLAFYYVVELAREHTPERILEWLKKQA